MPCQRQTSESDIKKRPDLIPKGTKISAVPPSLALLRSSYLTVIAGAALCLSHRTPRPVPNISRKDLPPVTLSLSRSLSVLFSSSSRLLYKIYRNSLNTLPFLASYSKWRSRFCQLLFTLIFYTIFYIWINRSPLLHTSVSSHACTDTPRFPSTKTQKAYSIPVDSRKNYRPYKTPLPLQYLSEEYPCAPPS